MSYETSLICDACSTVLAAGSKQSLMSDLKTHGGRVVKHGFTGQRMHVCGGCVRSGRLTFLDGTLIPALPSRETDAPKEDHHG